MTTLPVFCPVSTYLYASTIWSNDTFCRRPAWLSGLDQFLEIPHHLLVMLRNGEHDILAAM